MIEINGFNMRVFFTLLLVAFIIPCAAQAQTANENEKRRYFNSQGQYNSQIYNSPGSSSRGPLSLKQLLQGKENAANGSRSSSYYGGYNNRPYGVDNSNYSLSLSPNEIRAARQKRNALAQQRERESSNDLNKQASALYMEEETNTYLETFQSNKPNTTRRTNTRSQGQRPAQTREDRFEMPPKVFNSVR